MSSLWLIACDEIEELTRDTVAEAIAGRMPQCVVEVWQQKMRWRGASTFRRGLQESIGRI